MRYLKLNYHLMRAYGNGPVQSFIKAVRMSRGERVYAFPRQWGRGYASGLDKTKAPPPLK